VPAGRLSTCAAISPGWLPQDLLHGTPASIEPDIGASEQAGERRSRILTASLVAFDALNNSVAGSLMRLSTRHTDQLWPAKRGNQVMSLTRITHSSSHTLTKF
jgi:hypothetical protein